MKGASGGAPFRPRVPQPEAPATGSRSRGGGNTDGDDVVVSVEPALHGTVRNNRINQHVADMSAYLRGLSVYSSQGSLPPLSPHSAQLVDWNQPARRNTREKFAVHGMKPVHGKRWLRLKCPRERNHNRQKWRKLNPPPLGLQSPPLRKD